MKKAIYKDLKPGDKFFCWGDQLINYDSPVWCECVKDEDWFATEISPGKVRFGISPCTEISIEVNP